MVTVAQMEATQSQPFLEHMGDAGQAALWVGKDGWVTSLEGMESCLEMSWERCTTEKKET